MPYNITQYDAGAKLPTEKAIALWLFITAQSPARRALERLFLRLFISVHDDYSRTPTPPAQRQAAILAGVNFALCRRNVMIRFGFILVACLAWFVLPSSAGADCAKWDISGDWEFTQSNGLNATFHLSQDGDRISGMASYKLAAGGDGGGESQSLEGTFDQYGNLRIAVKWKSGAAAIYSGDMNAEGRLAGVVKDALNPGDAANWHQLQHNGRDSPVTCLAEAVPTSPDAPVAPATPAASEAETAPVTNNGSGSGEISAPALAPSPPTPPAGGKAATVIADVDVYKAAGGAGKSIGVLYSNNKSTKVSVVTPCQDNWCHVEGDPVPTGQGWVYSGTPPDFQSLQF
jgi:hypothetical protein